MLGLLQRVLQARVEIAGISVGSIDAGLLVLIGIEKGDTEIHAERLLERLLNYRVFADSNAKMNLSLRDTGGELLLVPQFTLAADTQKGTRPSFSSAATPEHAKQMFDHLLNRAHSLYPRVASGGFGADMQVSLVNDGPVTFLLRVESTG